MLKIKYVATELLQPYENNSKTHPDYQISQIENSIKELGFFEPLLIDENNTVLSGHARLQALKNIGEKKAPTVCLDGLTEEQKKKSVIAANKIQENAQWNMRTLHDEINSILELNPEVDLDIIGFSSTELESLLDMDFSPVLDPVAQTSEIRSDDIENAETRMADSIQGIQESKSSKGLEVMCPYCAETFTVTGT